MGDAIAQRLDHLVYKFVKKVQIVHRYKKSQGNGYYSASMSSVKQKNTWLFRVRSNATLGEIEQYAVNHVQGISWGDAFEERTEKKDTRVRQRSEDGNSEPGALSSSSRKVARTSEMQTSPTAPKQTLLPHDRGGQLAPLPTGEDCQRWKQWAEAGARKLPPRDTRRRQKRKWQRRQR